MKRIVLFVVFCLPTLSYAQKPGPVQPYKKPGSTSESHADTVITKDPASPKRDYWTIHSDKGTLKEQGAMLNGKRDGIWREYNDATSLLSRLSEYRDGLLHGVTVTFNINGAIVTEENYLNDKKDGPQSTYGNFAGRIRMLETYKEGILNGPKKTFYEDAKIQEDGSYKNGKRDGKVKWFLQNGTPTLEYTYVNGNLDGPAKVYDEKGNIKQEGSYKNGNEEGEWKEYQDSVLEKKIIYKEGQVLKEIRVKK